MLSNCANEKCQIIEITDRPDACMVRGHHNLLFSGDFARQFRLFAQLHQIELADTA